MRETLYGPWHIVLTHVNSHFTQSCAISGSDASDGRYFIEFGEPLEVNVSGPEWHLELVFWPFGGEDWEPSQTHRSTEFRPIDGLVVLTPSSSGNVSSIAVMRAIASPIESTGARRSRLLERHLRHIARRCAAHAAVVTYFFSQSTVR